MSEEENIKLSDIVKVLLNQRDTGDTEQISGERISVNHESYSLPPYLENIADNNPGYPGDFEIKERRSLIPLIFGGVVCTAATLFAGYYLLTHKVSSDDISKNKASASAYSQLVDENSKADDPIAQIIKKESSKENQNQKDKGLIPPSIKNEKGSSYDNHTKVKNTVDPKNTVDLGSDVRQRGIKTKGPGTNNINRDNSRQSGQSNNLDQKVNNEEKHRIGKSEFDKTMAKIQEDRDFFLYDIQHGDCVYLDSEKLRGKFNTYDSPTRVVQAMLKDEYKWNIPVVTRVLNLLETINENYRKIYEPNSDTVKTLNWEDWNGIIVNGSDHLSDEYSHGKNGKQKLDILLTKLPIPDLLKTYFNEDYLLRNNQKSAEPDSVPTTKVLLPTEEAPSTNPGSLLGEGWRLPMFDYSPLKN